jgi:putative SOS response-associated peptidase YedK
VKGGLDEIDFGDDLNASPGSTQPVVMLGEESHERELSLQRWGFKLGTKLVFNTRSVEAKDSKFWRERIRRRVIVPVSAYFEWPDEASSPKPKYEITVPGREYFGLAGLWSPWKNPKTGLWEKTFSLFTTNPNELIQKIHFRQPVILDPGRYEEWLADDPRFPWHLVEMTSEEIMKMELVKLPRMEITPKKQKEPLMKGLFD